MWARAGFAALACTAALWGAPSDANASGSAPPDTAVIEIEGASVMGARPGTTRTGSSVVKAALDSLPIPAAASLREVLEELPTVHVRTNSRGETEISLRGSESRQVSVLYDGLPLTLSWDGRTDASVVPVGAMRQVSLIPGLATLLSGPNVLGGVIEFQSTVAASRPGPARWSGAAGVDEVGGFALSGSVEAPRAVSGGVLTLRAGAGHRDTPGATLPSGVEQPLADEDLRINTDAVATEGFASARFDHDSRAWASVSSTVFRQDRGIAAELGVSAPRYWRYPSITRSLTVLSSGTGAQLAPWGGVLDLRASVGLDRGRTEVDAFDSIEYDSLISEEDGDQATFSMHVTGKQTLGRNADLRLSATTAQLTYDESLNPGVDNRYRHRLWSIAGESTLRRPMSGAGVLDELALALGLAYDRSTYPLSGDKPAITSRDAVGGRLGVSALMANGSVNAHANVSRRARFASLRELYSGALNRFTPNPDLTPEELTAGEVGVTIRDAAGSLQVVGFVQRLEDAVVRIRRSGRFVRVNQEGLRSKGVEVVGSRRFGAFSAGANVTLQKAELLDPSAALEQPENVPELSGGVRGELALPRDLSVGASVRHTGEQKALNPNDSSLATLAASTIVDVDLGHTWRIGSESERPLSLRTALSVHNAFDELEYDAFGLPGAGRLVRLEFRLQ